jgi:hypothetical protein
LSGINIDEAELCEMKDRLLQEEVSLAASTSIIIKQSVSQTIMSDASRPWPIT